MMKLLMPIMISLFMTSFKRIWMIFTSLLLTLSFMSILLLPTFHLSTTTNFFYIDSLSAPLLSLSLWISALMFLASQKIKINHNKPQKFLPLITLLLLSLLLTFSVNNLLMFYIFFEASLIPTFLLILGWGYQPERLQASMYLLMYTIVASLPLLLMIFFVNTQNLNMLLLKDMNSPTSSPILQTMWWMFMITAFLVKMPIYSMHLWLPKAHVEAPVAGSMVLAAILLKLGSYALIRVSFIFNKMNTMTKPILTSLSLLGAVYTSIICLRQTDLKALIAYSSVGHMGLLITATLTNTQWSWQGTLVLMIAHGLTSSALFAMANSIYESTHTRSIFLTKGLLTFTPGISLFYFILSASNMAAPPTINLLGEISLLTPTLAMNPLLILPLILLTLSTGAYSLHLYTSINHGQPALFTQPNTLLMNRNLTIPLLHSIPSLTLILKMDLIYPWL